MADLRDKIDHLSQPPELGITRPGSAREIPLSMRRQPTLSRVEADVRDCQITGKIPADLSGAFYRVGPDPHYPLLPRNIPFDGEGHVCMFRIRDGRVDYLSHPRLRRVLLSSAAHLGTGAPPRHAGPVRLLQGALRLDSQLRQHPPHRGDGAGSDAIGGLRLCWRGACGSAL
jgi:hypothetical protein